MAYADDLRSVTWTSDDIADLIEGVFSSSYGTILTSYTPTISTIAPLTIASTVVDYAKYIRIGKFVLAIVRGSGTLGGSDGPWVSVTMPVAMLNANSGIGAGWVAESDQEGGRFVVYASDLNYFTVGKADMSNWDSTFVNPITFAGVFVYEAA